MQKPRRRGNVPLTKDERIERIAGLVTEGKTNKEIAVELKVSRSRINALVRRWHLRHKEN